MRKIQLKGEYPDNERQYYRYKNKALDRFKEICIKKYLINIPVDNS